MPPPRNDIDSQERSPVLGGININRNLSWRLGFNRRAMQITEQSHTPESPSLPSIPSSDHLPVPQPVYSHDIEPPRRVSPSPSHTSRAPVSPYMASLRMRQAIVIRLDEASQAAVGSRSTCSLAAMNAIRVVFGYRKAPFDFDPGEAICQNIASNSCLDVRSSSYSIRFTCLSDHR